MIDKIELLGRFKAIERQLKLAYVASDGYGKKGVYEPMPPPDAEERQRYSPSDSLNRALNEIENAIAVLEHNFPVQACIEDTDGETHIYSDKKEYYIATWVTVNNPKAFCSDEVKIPMKFDGILCVPIKWRVPTCPRCRAKYLEKFTKPL